MLADPPAIVASSQAETDAGVIEVIGTRPEQTQKIDRRSYRVKPNLHSAQADTLQLLRGLPAVTISRDDEIMLLGAPNVAVMVDDRSIQGNVTQYLKTLHGSDIERIEVITNPSAQYSPQGTGGIINIVLRKQRDDGATGSAYGEVSSLGNGNAGATVKYKQGRWSFEVEARANGGQTEGSSYTLHRTVGNYPDAAFTTSVEDGVVAKFARGAFLSTKVAREINGKTDIYAKIIGSLVRFSDNSNIAFREANSDSRSFDERQRQSSTASFAAFELGFDHKGETEGETLKVTASVLGNPVRHSRLVGDLDEGGRFTIDRYEPNRTVDFQLGWVHPIGKSQILSMGAQWSAEKHELRYRFDNDSIAPSLGPDQIDQFKLLAGTLSAYATFQQQFGAWAVMPGIRIERNSRKISSPGRPTFETSRTRLFPTIHIRRPLSNALDLTLSYSKRIDQPGVNRLRPFPIMVKVNLAENGNPTLKDQSTDAYEINLHYSRKKFEAGLILYHREASDLFSSRFLVDPNGATVMTPINAGRRIDRGAEFDISTPLATRIKASASVNLFNSRVPIDPWQGSASAETFRYTGNATIEWSGLGRGDLPGDIAQLQFFYASPSRSYQVRLGGSSSATLSYTHSFSRTLSLTGTLSGLGTTKSYRRLVAERVREDLESRERGPEFKVKLVKTFGSSK